MVLQYIIKLIYFKMIYTLYDWQFNEISIFSDEKYLLLFIVQRYSVNKELIWKKKLFKENFNNTELNLC